MGQEPFSALHAETQHGPPGSKPFAPAVAHSNGTAPSHNDGEEPYTIRCICGFEDDDGNTVLCEQCETWQHIECYYYPHLTVPDIHKCSDCSPRPLDTAGASLRQKRRLREAQNSSDEHRKTKRAASKTHKRSKTKDPTAFPPHQLNGTTSIDRASRSPRDEPPPTKRPKTAHKTSKSINSISANHNHSHLPRKRSGSDSLPSQTPSNRPALADCPPDYFSPEFIRVHQENAQVSPPEANLFLNIGISDLLSTWLDDPHAFALATNGKSHHDIFQYMQTPIEDEARPIEKHIREDLTASFHGAHPRWPHLISDRDLTDGAFVGELLGSIGHTNDYKADPANDWDRLRHPDHFVFFHPQLPIYIDCRSEGTILRYARRSCRPNVRLQTIVTGKRDLHFCFVAQTDIPQGTEITLAWDLESDSEMREHLNAVSVSSADESHKDYVSRFISTVLAHFGGCACDHTYDEPCFLGRFDRRHEGLRPQSLAMHINKKQKTPRRSPSGMQRGPNSRAASETVLPANDEEMGEVTSSPRSSHSRTSQEPSPVPLYDGPPQMGNELSARDKRKLLQSEKLFQKIENQQDQKKKKRRSGSQLNTPTAASMPGRSYFSASDASTPGPSSKVRAPDNGPLSFPSPGLRSSPERSPPAQSPLPVARLPPLAATSRPVYTDAASQTEDTSLSGTCSTTIEGAERKPYVPLSQRLLRRNHLAQKWSQREPTERLNSLTLANADTSPSSTENTEGPKRLFVETDVHVAGSTSHEANTSTEQSHADMGTSMDVDEPKSPQNNFRATNFHVDLPPRQFLPPAESGSSTIGEVSGSTVLSPHTMASLPPMSAPIATMSPSLMTPTQTSLTQPSPIKKKMSLSDYSQRLKAKTPVTEKAAGQSLGAATTGLSMVQSPIDSNVESSEKLESSPTEGPAGDKASHAMVKSEADAMET